MTVPRWMIPACRWPDGRSKPTPGGRVPQGHGPMDMRAGCDHSNFWENTLLPCHAGGIRARCHPAEPGSRVELRLMDLKGTYVQKDAMTSLPVQQTLAKADFLAIMSQRGSGAILLDQAIALDRGELDLCHPGHLMRPTVLSQLARQLSKRYSRWMT